MFFDVLKLGEFRMKLPLFAGSPAELGMAIASSQYLLISFVISRHLGETRLLSSGVRNEEQNLALCRFFLFWCLLN